METFSATAALKEGFDYDYFANSAWLGPVIGSGDEECFRVFRHILAASTIWVSRIEGASVASIPEVEISEESLNALRDRWQAALERTDYLEPVQFQLFSGEARTGKAGDIATHVLYHGTYHRGQIRQMIGSKGLEFPDTDYFLFAMNRER